MQCLPTRIDFQKPVTIDVIPKGQVLAQYQLPGLPMGNYFAKVDAVPSNLGIYTSGRSMHLYEATSDIKALRSTTANIKDTWSMEKYGWEIELQGGEEQYFTHNISNWKN